MKRITIAVLAVLGVLGCATDPWSRTPAFVFPHDEFTVLRYYKMGDQVLIEFGFLDSFTNHCDPLSSFTSQDGTNVLTVTVHGKIAMRGDWPDLPGRVPRIENGNHAFAVPAKGLDVQRDKVFYRDDKGLYPIDFAGIRDKPFGPYVPMNSDSFDD